MPHKYHGGTRKQGIACATGPIGVVAAWLIIGASWALNSSWFAWTRDAYSDLGGPRSCCPILYNAGLALVGALLIAYGACLASCLPSRLGAVGAGYLALDGVFLGLIGYYHEGTRPHVFVSSWFFVQADVALILALYDAYRSGRGTPCLAALVLSAAAFPVAVLVGVVWGWPSAAVLETYGIIIIDVGVLALYSYCTRRAGMGERMRIL